MSSIDMMNIKAKLLRTIDCYVNSLTTTSVIDEHTIYAGNSIEFSKSDKSMYVSNHDHKDTIFSNHAINVKLSQYLIRRRRMYLNEYRQIALHLFVLYCSCRCCNVSLAFLPPLFARSSQRFISCSSLRRSSCSLPCSINSRCRLFSMRSVTC